MKTNTAHIASIIVVLLTGLTFGARAAYAAPSLTLTPAERTVNNNQTFTTTVSINTDGQSVVGANTIVAYPTADLELVSVTRGSFFTAMQSPSANGRIEISAYFSTASDTKSGSGDVATITFKALKSTGSSTVGFVCTGSTTDTQIYNSDLANILSCTNVNHMTIAYIGTTDATATPTPTTAPGATATPTHTPTPLPNGDSPNKRPDCIGLSALPAQGGQTFSPVTFSCGGKDNDGSIAAADFYFADRTDQTVNQNVGGTGTIMVKHTYREPGTYTVTCRVRDNSGVSSDIPAICTLTYTVKASAKGAPAVITTKRGTTVVTQTVTPTVPVITLAPYATPTDFILESETPAETVEETEEAASSSVFWIRGAIAALGIILLVIVIRAIKGGRRPPTEIPPVIPPQDVQVGTPKF